MGSGWNPTLPYSKMNSTTKKNGGRIEARPPNELVFPILKNQTIIPAATVALVESSMRTKLPV